MRIFLSHTSYDAPLAQFLRASLSAGIGLQTFMLPDDAPPGSLWTEQIKLGVDESDEILALITPESAQRSWIIAEWACFWMLGKPGTPLLVEVRIDDLWEPMRSSQAADLLNPERSVKLFERLAYGTGKRPAAGLMPLAVDVATEIPTIRRQQALIASNEVLERVSDDIAHGKENILPADIKVLVESERLDELVEVALIRHGGAREATPGCGRLDQRGSLRSSVDDLVKHLESCRGSYRRDRGRP